MTFTVPIKQSNIQALANMVDGRIERVGRQLRLSIASNWRGAVGNVGDWLCLDYNGWVITAQRPAGARTLPRSMYKPRDEKEGGQ